MTYTYSVHEYVNRFALAAIVSVIALSLPAHAGIVYHVTDIAIGSYNLDLNGDGVTDFTLGWASGGNCFHGIAWRQLRETPSSGNGAIVGPLKSGALIGPNQVFSEGAGVLATIDIEKHGIYCMASYEFGPWVPATLTGETTGFLGLSFQLDGQTYYGWAKLSVRGRPFLETTLLGYAYETTPGMPIRAGETDVKFTPPSLNFGTVTMGNTVSGSVTLTNLGATDLVITSATLSGTHAADFASDDTNPPCGGSVPVGGTCTLKFSFTPSISGTERATYSLSDSGGGSPQRLALTGLGQ